MCKRHVWNAGECEESEHCDWEAEGAGAGPAPGLGQGWPEVSVSRASLASLATECAILGKRLGA